MENTQGGRGSYLRGLAVAISVTDDFGLFRACVNCLSPHEAVDLLRLEAGKSSKLRDALLQKVVRDVAHKVCAEHLQLTETLLQDLSSADSRARQGLGYCLSSLHPTLPRKAQERIQAGFFSSRYVVVRRRGYKAANAVGWVQIELLLATWEMYRDPESALLLVKLLPPVRLLAMRGDLMPALSEGWMRSRLYLRLAEIAPETVGELESVDGISYCYVLAKLGRELTVAQAKAVVKRFEGDDRFGLVVWSLGQMKQWQVLTWLAKRLPEVHEARLTALTAKYAG
ncbi:hypothetical protein PMI15_02541 [Polaromonas sp. CF318]|uniref:hypothetical protein n=1 Tax=Polaromonas sp. CF318 TaxID=1144318 RepID=UPI000270F9A9|nr:hypothetical protein [Polaromonas sp. CF318]EJL83744.1 hypothetical protein PMI15_02541 [Polaromonas sp. CF318]